MTVAKKKVIFYLRMFQNEMFTIIGKVLPQTDQMSDEIMV